MEGSHQVVVWMVSVDADEVDDAVVVPDLASWEKL